MKRLLAIILIACLFLSVNAQTGIGVKAGVNLPNLSGDDASGDIKNHVGFYVGGLATIPIDQHFNFQPEILWSNKGYWFDELGEKSTTTFNYINIPLLVQYASKGFYAEAGPQIGFLVSAKTKSDFIEVMDVKDDYKSTSFSLGVGAGYRLPSGLGFGVRYTVGLNSIFSEDVDVDVKFNILMLGISKTFELKKKKK